MAVILPPRSGDVENDSNSLLGWLDRLRIKIEQVFQGSQAVPLLATNGIKFPATQVPSSDANTLDDYEEGTWTPTDASGAGLAFTGVDANYTKKGNEVTATATLTYPVTASGANSLIGGHPFTSKNSASGTGGNLIYTNSAVANKFQILTNSVNGGFASAAGALVTNAQMSGTLNYIQVVYPT